MNDLYELGKTVFFSGLLISGFLMAALALIGTCGWRAPRRVVVPVLVVSVAAFLGGVLGGALVMGEGRERFRVSFERACAEGGGDRVEEDLDEFYHCWSTERGVRIFVTDQALSGRKTS
jgi:hypothetical protein